MKTALNNAKIFDGEKIAFEKGSILFDESGILSLSEGPQQADRVIDATGKTVTPGLIDGHVHLGFDIVDHNISKDHDDIEAMESAAVIAQQLQKVWRYGITTVCNCATGSNADIYVRNLIKAGVLTGARVVACGQSICITGGHAWPDGLECDTPDEVRKAARLQLRRGVDLVKLLATGGMGTKGSIPNAPQLSEEQMRVAVQEAERFNAITRAHATGLEGAQNAARAGVRIIDHTQLDEPTAQLLAEKGAFYCPTIVTRYRILHTEDPRYQFMRAKADPQDLVRKQRALMLCKKLGITIVAGTDAGPNAMVALGDSLWTELGIYTEYGLTTLETLRAATKDAALALKLDGVTGALVPGLAADIAVFSGDPTADIHDVEKVYLTFQGGKLAWCDTDSITL